MHIKSHNLVGAGASFRRHGVAAFTLVEVLVSMWLFSVGFTSLYMGITSGVQIIQTARENLRATQIMTEKMETMRLYAWEQVIGGTNIPSSFVDFYYPIGPVGSRGTPFYGSVSITDTDFETSYAADVRQVIVKVSWTNASVGHSRQMRTLVARNGMQNYIF